MVKRPLELVTANCSTLPVPEDGGRREISPIERLRTAAAVRWHQCQSKLPTALAGMLCSLVIVFHVVEHHWHFVAAP